MPSFIDSKDMTRGYIKKKWVIHMLKLDILYLPVYKIGDSRFRHYRDMIAGVETENGSCNPDHATF